MSAGVCCSLIAIAQTTSWGWTSTKTLGLLFAGLAIIAVWILYEVRSKEPLIDMAMMRIRGVWTTNLVAFLLGAGLYSSFLLYPQFAQLPKSTGFGYGASIVASGLYLLPGAAAMGLLGSAAGKVARRFGSKPAMLTGTAITAFSFALFAAANSHPYNMLIASALLGIGIGLAFAALGNLIVGAVPPEQTGVATGMNTVLRTLGGAVGAQIAATVIASHTVDGLPSLTGYTISFLMATGFLVVCVFAGTLVPSCNSTPVTAPLALTLATLLFDEDQLAAFVTDCVVPSDSVVVHVS